MAATQHTIVDNVGSRFDHTVEHNANVWIRLAAKGRLDVPARRGEYQNEKGVPNTHLTSLARLILSVKSAQRTVI